jgi:serine/threonine protein kinase/formylglycine-generating enzyme required for sulfatase activity
MVIGGRYTLDRQLGEGAFGEVWQAGDTKAFGRKVAVKFLLEQHLSNAEVVRRFWQEGQATAALTHPNVVALLEFGEDAKVPFLVSEFVEGDSLRKILETRADEKKLLSIDEALAIFRPACGGVAAAHAKNIVHRDLKPENLMVQGLNTPTLVVKVLDFGVARILGKDSSQSLGRTEVGKIIGSLQYMSPEQVLGDVTSIDQRTDVFALAAVLFEILALRPAYDGGSYQEVIGKILDPNRPKLQPLRADLGAALDPVFAQAFAMHRDQRLATVPALLEAVETAVEPYLKGRSTAPAKPAIAVPDLSGAWGGQAERRSGDMSVTVDASPDGAVTPRSSQPVANDASESKRMLLGALIFVTVALGSAAIGTAVLKNRLQSANPGGTAVIPIGDASVVQHHWVPPPEHPADWVLIEAPSTPFVLGHDAAHPEHGGLAPVARVTFAGPAFRLMKHEVSFAEYEPWSEAHPEHRLLVPPWVPSELDARAALPVVNVQYASASAYCEAIGATLPTEEQWEFAARGSAGALNPWAGDTVPAAFPGFQGPTAHLLPAGSSNDDISTNTIAGLGGNGQEWTQSVYREDDGTVPHWQQPYRVVRGLPLREVLPAGTARPAAYLYRNAGCASANCSAAERLMLENVGFRCAKPAS